MKEYCIYIMASSSGTLYVGVTNVLYRRVYEHKQMQIDGFTKKYKCIRLVFYEQCHDVKVTIAREKQIKNWNRVKKENLIQTSNPGWRDLSQDWE